MGRKIGKRVLICSGLTIGPTRCFGAGRIFRMDSLAEFGVGLLHFCCTVQKHAVAAGGCLGPLGGGDGGLSRVRTFGGAFLRPFEVGIRAVESTIYDRYPSRPVRE